MALRQIVKEGDSVLTKKCRPVVKFDDRLADLIDDMIETLHKAEGVVIFFALRLVGLAFVLGKR